MRSDGSKRGDGVIPSSAYDGPVSEGGDEAGLLPSGITTVGNRPCNAASSLVGDSQSVDSLLRDIAHASDIPLGGVRLLVPGARLAQGRFEITRRLGAGGMGVVYAAHDYDRGCPVALKTMRALTPEALRRLRSEFLALHDLVHPNLV